MYEALLEDLEATFPGKLLLTSQDICQYLGCDMAVVYNWNKRTTPERRPPALQVGKELRFQKKLFARWLAKEQSRSSD
jgi:hypothetical protein